MSNLRTGTFGDYYGSYYNESAALTQTQMKKNAGYVFSYFTYEGWTPNAIAAMLGNMQVESSINPGRWQSDNVGGGPAYGIVQWDPWSKYVDWCTEQGFSDPSEMDNNLARIMYELENGGQWYATDSYDLTFREFSTSTESPSYLAAAFVKNYERPADQSESVLANRGSLADAWYTYITGQEPSDPSDPGGSSGSGSGSTKKRTKYKFVLFGKRRRILHG
ncbi:MAG: hypothetical protein J6T08_02575 [Lentisphaeria bacterium]|nr:hypothetical protein [Lentisphaeria bacterium]